MNRLLLAAAFVAAVSVTAIVDAAAGPRQPKIDEGPAFSEHPKAAYYRKRSPQVRSYVQRRGGYSYYAADSINTYGSSRTLYGGTMLYRDPMLDRQSSAGPFDHGFFFDSGTAPRGGDSPYMQ